MFTLKINGAAEPFALEWETTFGQVMEKLSTRMNESGRVITEIVMNEQSLTGGKQLEYYKFPLNDVEIIELTTADPEALAKEAINSLAEYKEELRRNCFRAAELFRLGDELEANEIYSRLLDGWRWLMKGLSAMMGMLNIDQDAFRNTNRDAERFQDEKLLPLFDEMFDAQKRQDWIALADLLEFELAPALNEMADFFLKVEKIIG